MNVGKKSFFLERIIVDFYDEPTEAICKSDFIDQSFIASLVCFDCDKKKIFSLVKISPDWLNKYKAEIEAIKSNNFDNYARIKTAIIKYYKNYSGDVYLFKSQSLLGINYEIVKIKVSSLKYFRDIQYVIRQDKKQIQNGMIFLKQLNTLNGPESEYSGNR
jgi:hypothetical protein